MRKRAAPIRGGLFRAGAAVPGPEMGPGPPSSGKDGQAANRGFTRGADPGGNGAAMAVPGRNFSFAGHLPVT